VKQPPPRLTGDDHVESLIPWYVNGTLNVADVRRVQRHLELCDPCRASADLERKLAALLLEHRDTLDCAPQSGWNKLAAQLDTHPQVSADAAPLPKPRGVVRRYFFPLLLTLQAAAIAGLSIALVNLIQERDVASYHTLSEVSQSQPAAGPTLRVVFTADTSNDQLRTLLQPIGGTIRSGPSANGVYTIEIERSDVTAALAWLRSQSQVMFAEPVRE